MRKILFYRFENGECPVRKYLDALSSKEVEKVFFVLDLIEQLDMVPVKFFKKLEATDGIWEARVQYGGNIFRFLGFFDGNNLVVLNHAFTRKQAKPQPGKYLPQSAGKKTILRDGGCHERRTEI
jgi:phage-related protein